MKLSAITLVLMLSGFFSLAQESSQKPYEKGSLIVKLKNNYADKCNKSSINIPAFQALLENLSVQKLEKLFPRHSTVKRTKSTLNHVDLSTIYRLSFDEKIDPYKITNQLLKVGYVEYAEPEFINHLAYTPNDSLTSQQWYLNAIQAYQAWDIQKGDTAVVIAINDTGSDLDHEDLKEAFALNYADPINGIDDDNDGYIDNFNGWDVANNNNNTSFGNSGHGTNVAGLASASTDNIFGMSGCGFNTKILSIRIDDDITGGLTGAYDGIIYAADHGAFIINNSWGNYFYSRLAQDVINYAAINKGALVVCAAGNGPFTGPNAGIGTDDRFYPAAYENVFSVGAVMEGDTVKESSNFGYWVDVFAPGENMITTAANGGYGVAGGTSMAAPILAGVAALVKSEFPNFTAKQVKQKILSAADDISAVNEAKYQNKLGAGRINAFKALIDSTSPGIAFENKVITDQNDETFLPGDTLRIFGDFTNYLANATNVNVSIRPTDNHLELIDGSTNLGNISTMATKSNKNDPFVLVIKSGQNFNQLVDLELSITADNYAVKRFFSLTINPSYITVNENNLSVTLPSNGKIGFAAKDANLGVGIKYLNGNSLLYEGGFLIGNSASYVSNSFRNDNQGTDDDFKIITSIRNEANSDADFEAYTVYNDQNNVNPPQVEIEQRNYFFNTGKAINSVIYVYAIKNISGVEIQNLHAGIILDWDIEDYSSNKIYFDAPRQMGVSYSSDTNLFCGVRTLTENSGNTHYAIDNEQGGNGGINLLDGFSDFEKYQSISLNRDSAGTGSVKGNDIIDVNAVGPFSIPADSIKVVAFSITVSESKANLEEEADSIAKKFQQLSLNLRSLKLPALTQSIIYPNPANNELSVNLNLQHPKNITMEVFDVSGKLIYSNQRFLSTGIQQIQLNTASWKTGVYVLKIKGDKLIIQNTFVVAR